MSNTNPVHKSLTIEADATVCSESTLKGPIHIGSRTVIHPRACIHAESGPIIIGEYNLFEEQTTIKNVDPDGHKLKIGSNNVFEVGATVLAKSIGDNNVFESKCYVGPEVEVGNGCTIGAAVTLTLQEKLPDNIVISGSNCDRRIAPDKPMPQTLQLDFLSKVLPNYHYTKKSNADKSSSDTKAHQK